MAFGRPRAALLAGLLFAASGLLGLEARLAVPDAVLLATMTLAAGALARLWQAKEEPPPGLALPLIFWTAVGAGILVKGLVAAAIVLATVTVLSFLRGSFDWTRRLKPLAGLIWLLVLLSPWIAAATISAFGGNVTPPGAECLRRIGAPYAPVAPPGVYTLLVPLVAGPVITFFFLAFPWLLDNLKRPVVVFTLAWGVPYWAAIELIPAKLPHLALPAVPAIAIVAATAVDVGATRIGGWASWFYSLGPLVWPPLLAVAIPVAFFAVEGSFPYLAFAAMAIGAVVAVVGTRRSLTAARCLRLDPERALGILRGFRIAIVGLCFAAGGIGWLLEISWLFWVSVVICGEEVLESSIGIAALRHDPLIVGSPAGAGRLPSPSSEPV
jgi:4-amino-4-deoxy-L-arabinose transferase-like glycosyltransferase